MVANEKRSRSLCFATNLIFNLQPTTISQSIASHLCANFAPIQQAFNKYWSVLFSIRDFHGLCLVIVIVCGRFNIHSWGSSLMGCVHKLRLKYFIQRWVWSLRGFANVYTEFFREMPKNAWGKVSRMFRDSFKIKVWRNS